MIDKKTEAGIKAMKEFLEFWTKFHHIYNATISKELISDEDEHKFLQTKETMRTKYEEVKGSLDVNYVPHSRLTDPVSDVLSLGGIRFISEKNLKKLNEDWRDSYVFLNSIMERLKNKKKRLEQFNPVRVFVKRFFERRLPLL
jgi:hypothetical protein